MDTSSPVIDTRPVLGAAAEEAPRATANKIRAKKVSVFYDDKQALSDVSLDMPDRSVTALIGPSGCGKSTFLRCMNRMNDTIQGARVEGVVELDGENINARSVDPVSLRARVGMVFQRPNPFPKSIFENVAYGPRIHGLTASKSELRDVGRELVQLVAVGLDGVQGHPKRPVM